MLTGPLLMAIVPGSLTIMLAWWFRRKGFSLVVRVLPGCLAIIAAIIIFYIGFFNIRGFEGAAYMILAFFLSFSAVISFMIGRKKATDTI